MFLRFVAGVTWRVIVIGAGLYFLFVIFQKLELVAVALFGALVITAVLRPVTNVLARALPRGLSVAVAMLTAVVVVLGLLTFIGVSVANQTSELGNSFTRGVRQIEDWLNRGPARDHHLNLDRAVQNAGTWISDHRGAIVNQALGGASVALELLTGLALAFFCAVFFISSGSLMWAWFVGQLPARHADGLDRAAQAGWSAFAGYTRGVFLVAGTNAAFVAVALLVLRVPLALPLALLTFFASFVPLIGAPIALAVATVVALAGRGAWIALIVAALIVVIGQVEGHLLHPLIMSRNVKLHPVVVALSVAIGTLLAGVVGAVVAVPIVSVVWAVTRAVRGARAHPVPATSTDPELGEEP